MQYSQRDPNRDKSHGRIYRLTAKERPLLKPISQEGRSVAELLNQLKEYEPRTRYAARRELWERPKEKVLSAVRSWAEKLDSHDTNYDHHLCEALWVEQGHHAVDRQLLAKILHTKTADARASATHVLADEWNYVADPMELLRPQVRDEHPRVRLEAVRALSFVETAESAELALEVTRQPLDYWLDYTLQHTLGALEPLWKPPFERNELATDHPKAREFLQNYVGGKPQLGELRQYIKELANYRQLKPKQRDAMMKSVVKAHGKADNGRQIFERVCVACHKVGDKGAEFGPDLTHVATRLKKEEIIESIVDPNAKVDPKFVATNITTKDGEELSGLVAAEDANSVTMVLGAGVKQLIKKSNIETRQALKVSSMPDGLAEGMSPEEFLDLVEFLAVQK
jgi:putative heme-binding domain-containing protein